MEEDDKEELTAMISAMLAAWTENVTGYDIAILVKKREGEETAALFGASTSPQDFTSAMSVLVKIIKENPDALADAMLAATTGPKH